MNRFRAARKELKYKQKDVASKLGVTYGYVCDVECDVKKPSKLYINAFCSIFHVNPEWLATGKGDMFQPPVCPFVSEEARRHQ